MDAEQMIAALCQQLAQAPTIAEDDYSQEGIPGEKTTVAQARQWALQLLRAAHANGLSGCLLCRS